MSSITLQHHGHGCGRLLHHSYPGWHISRLSSIRTTSRRHGASTANNFICSFQCSGHGKTDESVVDTRPCLCTHLLQKPSSKPTMFDVHLEAGSFGRAAGRCFEHDGISCLRSPMQADASSARHPPHITYNITSSMVAGDSLLTSQAARRQRRRHLSGAADMLTGASSQLIDCAAVPAAQHRRWNCDH